MRIKKLKVSKLMLRSINRAMSYVGHRHVIDVVYEEANFPSFWQYPGFYACAIIHTSIGLTIYVYYHGEVIIDGDTCLDF